MSERVKIKDNVDLKELEKFGLSFDEETGKYECRIGGWWFNGDYDKPSYVLINVWNKKICIELGENVHMEKILCVLFDLFQAGLVEKVKEEG